MKSNKIRKFIATLVSSVVLVSTVCPSLPIGEAKMAKVEAASANFSRVSVHDPSIVKGNNGYYYVFGSHMAFAKSKDLQNWTYFTNNINTNYSSIFSVGAKWAATNNSKYNVSGNLWAPDVIYNPKMKKWCMYMSINGDEFNSSIALATADNIEGPYTYRGTIVYSGFTQSTHPVSMTDYYKVCGQNASISRYLINGQYNMHYGTNAIDPNVFYDQSGKLWMIYGSWFGGLFMLELDENTGLRDYNVKYALDTNASDGVASDPYLGIRVAGGLGSSGEAPYIEYMDGYYYLFSTYGGLTSDGGYNMRVFRSKNVTGPYKDVAGNYATYTTAMGSNNTSGNVGERLISYSKWSCQSKAQVAQGHNSVLTDSDGKKYLVYHTRFDDGNEFHELRVHQLFTNKDGWLVTAPFEYTGESLKKSGYTTAAVVGTYEFMENYLSASTLKKIATTKTITLSSNGKVSGAVNGTWSMTNGTPYMTFSYNGVTYKGVFLEQKDESSSRKNVMTFTAVGSNNVTIMGANYGYNQTEAKKTPSTSSNTGSTSTTVTKSTNKVYADGWYYIKNVNSQKYLEAASNTGSNGVNVQIGKGDGDLCQKWYLKNLSDGKFTLTNGNGYLLDVANGATSNSTNIQVWSSNGATAQQYMIGKTSTSGQVAIMTVVTNGSSCLDVANASANDGANVCQYQTKGSTNQLWIFESTNGPAVNTSTPSTGSTTTTPSTGSNTSSSTVAVTKVTNKVYADGWYYIKNVGSQKYMEAATNNGTNGTNVQIGTGDGDLCQKWYLKNLPDGKFTLTNASGYLLDVVNGLSADNTNIQLWASNGATAQQYMIGKTSKSGQVAIMTVVSNGASCLDVAGGKSADGTNICEYKLRGSVNQLWVFESTSAPR